MPSQAEKGLLFCLCNGNTFSSGNCLKSFLSFFVESSVNNVTIFSSSCFSPAQCTRASFPTDPPRSLPPGLLMTLFLVPGTHPSSLHGFRLNYLCSYSWIFLCFWLLSDQSYSWYSFSLFVFSCMSPPPPGSSFLNYWYFSTFCLSPCLVSNSAPCAVLTVHTLSTSAHKFTNHLCAEAV